MSLDWNLSKIENHEKRCWIPEGPEQEKRMAYDTEALIFMTISVGMGCITEENWEQFYKRTAIAETAFGTFLRKRHKETGELVDVPITPDIVRDHIGLRCNVGHETDAVFYKRIRGILTEKAERQLRWWKEEQEKHERESKAVTADGGSSGADGQAEEHGDRSHRRE